MVVLKYDYIPTNKTRLMFIYMYARFAGLRCVAGGHFVFARSALAGPVLILINYKGAKISKFLIIKKVTMTSLFHDESTFSSEVIT